MVIHSSERSSLGRGIGALVLVLFLYALGCLFSRQQTLVLFIGGPCVRAKIRPCICAQRLPPPPPIQQGTYTWADGRKHVGGWQDGKQHGQVTATLIIDFGYV